MMDPKPPVRIAVVGFGGLIGRRHTAHVLSSPSATLVAVVDGAPDASDLAAQLAPGVPYYRSVTDMLSGSAAGHGSVPDAAIVCTPNAYHVPVALELAEAGVHLLVEKPLADTKAAARILVDRARELGVKLLVGHHRRFNPYVVAAKKVLATSEAAPGAEAGSGIGLITAVSGLWTTYKPDQYFAAAPWRRSRKQGGGPVMINFVHEVDVLQYLLGPILRVSAERMVGGGGAESSDPDLVERGAALTLRFASGAVGSFVLSDAVVSPHFFEAGTGENPTLPRARRPCQHQIDRRSGTETQPADQPDATPVDVYRIFGTHGTLSVPDMTLWTCGDAPRSWTNKLSVRQIDLDDDPRVPFDRQLDHFTAVVRGEVTVADEAGCTGEQGLRVIAVCEAVIQALDDAEGGKVVVDYT
ncbi:putative oxidoreductase [Rosellinia necatrix]|uniref:Putative oxidoreductase n=1 Tax=Rosellinia necatrix TaxID=77044 RepID=A0A1W2TU68_ROSNE|nr:putative oxidoreductase [Rosellinia necatrix]